MEKNIVISKEYNSSSFYKFLIPSLIGLLLFIIPLPYGNIFKIEGLSSINIGIGFLAELIKISLSEYLNYIALAVIVTSAVLSILCKFISPNWSAITVENGNETNEKQTDIIQASFAV